MPVTTHDFTMDLLAAPPIYCPNDSFRCRCDAQGPFCGYCGWRPADTVVVTEPDRAKPAVSVAPPVPGGPTGLQARTLQLQPDRLDFGNVAADAKAERQTAARYDTGEQGDVIVSGELPAWLIVEPLQRGRLRVVVDTGKWQGTSSTPFDETIRVMDRRNGSVVLLHVSGEFTVPRIRGIPASIEFGRTTRNTSPTRSLQIENGADGELLLKEIVLDQAWLEAETSPASAGSSMELRLTANAAAAGKGRHEAEVRIVSNDRARPVVIVRTSVQVSA